MKKVLTAACAVVLCLIVLSAALSGCGGEDSDAASGSTESPGAASNPTTAPATGEKIFTEEELAEFDGMDGSAAYIAVDGVVYDVSESAKWPQGEHSPCPLGAMAGNNLSEEIKQAPARMRALLEKMPVVGKLEQ